MHRRVLRAYPQFVNKYEGRSNGGIPCFAEERILYRAAKVRTILRHLNSDNFYSGVETAIQLPIAQWCSFVLFSYSHKYLHLQVFKVNLYFICSLCSVSMLIAFVGLCVDSMILSTVYVDLGRSIDGHTTPLTGRT